MKEVKLPSGSILKITLSPFPVSKALFQALMKEGKGIQITSKTEMSSLYKDLFCIGFSSELVEKCVWECIKKCTLDSGKGDLRITEDTFEPIERRDDYLQVCMEVAKENVLPFMNSLYAEYQRILAMIDSTPA